MLKFYFSDSANIYVVRVITMCDDDNEKKKMSLRKRMHKIITNIHAESYLEEEAKTLTNCCAENLSRHDLLVSSG